MHVYDPQIFPNGNGRTWEFREGITAGYRLARACGPWGREHKQARSSALIVLPHGAELIQVMLVKKEGGAQKLKFIKSSRLYDLQCIGHDQQNRPHPTNRPYSYKHTHA